VDVPAGNLFYCGVENSNKKKYISQNRDAFNPHGIVLSCGKITAEAENESFQ
jgi:hypothetical protein